jgi:acyl-CoA dehydrogenase
MASSDKWLSTCIFPAHDPPSDKDPEGLAIEQTKEGFVLNGRSALTVGAGFASSFLIFARPRGALVDGPITSFLIPPDRAGVEPGDREIFSGLKALPIQQVVFTRVKVDDEDIVGGVNKADPLLRYTRNLLHAFLGACAMGLARSSYNKALAYACERYQYGKVIAHHQEIQRLLGQMLTSLHAGTALYIQSLSGQPLEGICSQGRGEYAKIFCTNTALQITIDTVQIHGGYGYMQDYGVEKLMRDAKLVQLLEGQNPVLQIEAAREEVEKAGLA